VVGGVAVVGAALAAVLRGAVEAVLEGLEPELQAPRTRASPAAVPASRRVVRIV